MNTFTQTASGGLQLFVDEFGGTVFNDAVVATGNADLAGVMAVFAVNGYDFAFGDYFVLVDAAGGVSGTFDAVGIAGLDASLNADVIYRATEVVLSINAALAGDYNNDGIVNGADYTVWADNFGSLTNLTADGSGNGVVDSADYTVWADNFGMTSSLLAAGSANVPEPGTAALVAVAAVLSALSVRRGRAA